MGRPTTINWVPVDVDIREQMRICDIAEKHAISRSSVSSRANTIGCRPNKTKRVSRMKPASTRNLERALRIKTTALGQPVGWVRDVWLKGVAGRQFMSDGGY